MLKNYFNVAWRNFLKHKGFSFINIFGLAIGLAASGLIALYVTDELSYDNSHRKGERIFRVIQRGTWSGGGFNLAVTSAPYAAALKNDFANVEDVVRIHPEGGGKIIYGEKQLDAGDVFFADNSIFNIFTYSFLDGDAKDALLKPASVILTRTLAEKLFGDASLALNKTIFFGRNFPSTVTGVIDDVPQNSHFRFSALRSFDPGFTTEWNNASLYTYVLLKDPSTAKNIESQSVNFYNKYLKSSLSSIKFTMELQPLKDIHLHSDLGYEMGPNGNIIYVYVFSMASLLILIIAVINYVNLTTARSSARVKEIGVRKVIGSGRKTLMIMFFAESVLLVLFATAIAAVIIQLVLPSFNVIAGKTLSVQQFGILNSCIAALLFALVTGLLSGVYPALFLSGFRAIPAMKGQLGDQSSTVLFRQGLVTFQFVVTIVMIAASLIIYQQLDYVKTKDLGFNRAQTLTFHIHNQSVRAQVGALREQLIQNPNIQGVGIAGNPIGNNDLGSDGLNPYPEDKSWSDRKVAQNLVVDEHFIPALEIKIAQGRNFSQAMPTDKTDAIILNETLVKELGWKDAIGRRVEINDQLRTVIGVTKDFNTYSLQHKLTPVVLTMPARTNDQDNVYIRVSPENIQASLAYITKVFSRFDQENKPEFHFLDQNFGAQYKAEEKQGKLLVIFTVLAITIASLGLLGLVTFSAQQRMKEIGVRKVLGAKAVGIIMLLSKDLLKLVVIAMFIAIPLAAWAMHSWLQTFAYRVELHWWVFALSGIIAISIAIITVSFQATKAALANPVKSLRLE